MIKQKQNTENFYENNLEKTKRYKNQHHYVDEDDNNKQQIQYQSKHYKQLNPMEVYKSKYYNQGTTYNNELKQSIQDVINEKNTKKNNNEKNNTSNINASKIYQSKYIQQLEASQNNINEDKNEIKKQETTNNLQLEVIKEKVEDDDDLNNSQISENDTLNLSIMFHILMKSICILIYQFMTPNAEYYQLKSYGLKHRVTGGMATQMTIIIGTVDFWVVKNVIAKKLLGLHYSYKFRKNNEELWYYESIYDLNKITIKNFLIFWIPQIIYTLYFVFSLLAQILSIYQRNIFFLFYISVLASGNSFITFYLLKKRNFEVEFIKKNIKESKLKKYQKNGSIPIKLSFDFLKKYS